MTSDKSIVKREEIGLALTPAQVVDQATEQAKLLMNIVESREIYQQIGDKKYLEVEAWQTIGAFNRIHALTDWVQAIEDESKEEERGIIGYEAKVDLWKDGEQIGSAIMSCGLDEFPCQGKVGMAKHKAAKSAAQTWAESKAYRMNFAYIAVLAGYQPTPAEEMTGQEAGTLPKQSKSKVQETQTKGHWCAEHKVVFFKKGEMKNYAHPIKDANGQPVLDATGKPQWCNEAKKAEEKSAISGKPLPEAVASGADTSNSSPAFEGVIDLGVEVEKTPSKDRTLITPDQLKHLTNLLKEASMALGDLGKWMVEKGWTVRKLVDIEKWQFDEIIAAFAKGKP